MIHPEIFNGKNIKLIYLLGVLLGFPAGSSNSRDHKLWISTGLHSTGCRLWGLEVGLGGQLDFQVWDRPDRPLLRAFILSVAPSGEEKRSLGSHAMSSVAGPSSFRTGKLLWFWWMALKQKNFKQMWSPTTFLDNADRAVWSRRTWLHDVT